MYKRILDHMRGGTVAEVELMLEENRSAGLVELTEWEREHIERTQSCPDCLTGVLVVGPKAACSVNVTCDGCGARFNVGVACGVVLFAERIREPRAPACCDTGPPPDAA